MSNETTWKSQAGYVWSLIGSAVGFANILSFSAQVYKNGGGAFLIPYCIALFILGIPLLILEGLVGHRFKLPLVPAFGQVWGKAGKILGWLSVLACLSIGAFYIVLTGYSVAYTYYAAANAIPEDSKAFFLHAFLQVSPSLEIFGGLSLPILLATLSVAGATYFVLVREVRQGIEKICSIFMPLLALMMTLFAVSATLLPGGLQGWSYYLSPDFSRLLDPALWRDVFGQLFFSLSLGLGIIVGYSRHTGQAMNISKSMMYVALGDFAVSFISGAAIFCCLAHISSTQGIPFDSILNTESTFEIGFIVFPQILKFFGPHLSLIIGALFFFCIFIAGITGCFSIVESIAGNVEVEFRTSRRRAVGATLLVLAGLGVFFCMGNGSHLIDALAPMVIGTNMLIGGLALIFAFRKYCQEMPLCSFSLKYIAPMILIAILVANLSQEMQQLDLAKSVRWGWLFVAFSASLFLTQIRGRLERHPLRPNGERNGAACVDL